MAFQRVPDTALFVLSWTDGAVVWQNGIYVRDEVETWDDASLTTVGEALRDWQDTKQVTIVNGNWAAQSIEGRSLDEEFGASVTIPVTATGSDTGATGPYNVAAVIQLRGDSGGPPRRGWLFHGGLVDENIGGRTLAGGFVTEAQGIYDDLPGDITAAQASAAMVIVSRYESVTNPTPPPANITVLRSEAVTNTLASIACRSRLGTIRRRLD